MTAHDILERYLTDEDGKVSFPVDTVALARDLGAEVFVATTDVNVASFVVKDVDDSSPRIYLSSRNTEKGNRIACAEEVSHILPHLEKQTEKYGYVTEKQFASGEMSDFAAELIMPGFAVRKYWAKGHSTKKIAKIFGVGELAMETRIRNLGLFGLS